jgi:hypothetical protein
MLIDFIPIERLPHIIVWLDWVFYVYWPTLLTSFLVLSLYYWLTPMRHSVIELAIGHFSGFCGWLGVCFFLQGYGVG